MVNRALIGSPLAAVRLGQGEGRRVRRGGQAGFLGPWRGLPQPHARRLRKLLVIDICAPHPIWEGGQSPPSVHGTFREGVDYRRTLEYRRAPLCRDVALHECACCEWKP
jgi:hypothetical protein